MNIKVIWRGFLLIPIMMVTTIGFINPTAAGAAQVADSSLSISVDENLNCSVQSSEIGTPAFDVCGTFVAFAGSLYGPAGVSVPGLTFTPYTPVSQRTLRGSGTASDPYRLTTTVEMGSTGLQMTQVDSYVTGEKAYKTEVRMRSLGGAPNVRVYRVADCTGTSSGYYDAESGANGTVACKNGNSLRLLQATTPGGVAQQGASSTIWARVNSQQDMLSSCACGTTQDSALGVSWFFNVYPEQTWNATTLTVIDPNGFLPVVIQASPAHTHTHPQATDDLIVNVRNLNNAPVSLSKIVASLPTGFSYMPSTMQGDIASAPTVSGQELTWGGSFSIAPQGSLNFRFTMRNSRDPGEYTVDVRALSPDGIVAPLLFGAPISVGGPSTTTSTTTTLMSTNNSSTSSTISTESSSSTTSSTESTVSTESTIASSTSSTQSTASTTPTTVCVTTVSTTNSSTSPPSSGVPCSTTSSSTTSSTIATSTSLPPRPTTTMFTSSTTPTSSRTTTTVCTGPGGPGSGSMPPGCATTTTGGPTTTRTTTTRQPTGPSPAFSGANPKFLVLAGLVTLLLGGAITQRLRPKHMRH